RANRPAGECILASKRRAKNNKRDRVTNGKVAHNKAGIDNAGNGNTTNDKLEALESFRESGADELLTTNHGTRINDNQNSLKAGARGPSLLEDFILREKITHFDHERIPERVVHARGAAAHGVFKVYKPLGRPTPAAFLPAPRRPPPGPRQGDAGVRALLHGGRLARLDRPRPRRPGFRGEVLHRGGEFRSRGKQYPGLLHSGRGEVPRSRPR